MLYTQTHAYTHTLYSLFDGLLSCFNILPVVNNSVMSMVHISASKDFGYITISVLT